MRKKRKKRIGNTGAGSSTQPERDNERKSKGFAGSWKFLVGSGISALLATGAYQYLVGDVSLEFVQALNRGYEFQLKNATPSDKVVKRFRVSAPSQQLVYHTTQDLYANITPDGKVELPGGNINYIPAAAYKELDGQKILANSEKKFRLPPLSDRPWMEPDAAIFSIQYEIESSNPILSSLEHALTWIGLRSTLVTVKYLVVSNYWIPTTSDSPGEAMRIFCRDNHGLASASICRGYD
ncbi:MULTISPECIES: hypothetical protein [Ralstonia]|uniref:hypothetical protein n=1 Tax=Ralstonia TaxID=48736 RepID=UPI0011AF47A3|nr:MULTISPECIES: hypothetical protein [Ralstonia]